MRAGYNPTRRSRKIGTPAQGHSQNNKMVVPSLLYGERHWAESLRSFNTVTKSVIGRDLTFIVEETSLGCEHSCSIADVCHVLKHIPFDDWHDLSTFLFRQPTLKQRSIVPVWGRLFYSADLGAPGGRSITCGPTLMLEATKLGGAFSWPKSLRPLDRQELERLRADGHEISDAARHHIITTTADSVRATQLYRTLPHEIGHWVDFLIKVERAKGDYQQLINQYFSRPSDEREAFAHRYADVTRAKLTKSGVFPFDPLPDIDPQ